MTLLVHRNRGILTSLISFCLRWVWKLWNTHSRIFSTYHITEWTITQHNMGVSEICIFPFRIYMSRTSILIKRTIIERYPLLKGHISKFRNLITLANCRIINVRSDAYAPLIHAFLSLCMWLYSKWIWDNQVLVVLITNLVNTQHWFHRKLYGYICY
jgi:hypothetical protein